MSTALSAVCIRRKAFAFSPTISIIVCRINNWCSALKAFVDTHTTTSLIAPPISGTRFARCTICRCIRRVRRARRYYFTRRLRRWCWYGFPCCGLGAWSDHFACSLRRGLTRSHYFSCDLPVAGRDFAGDLRSHFSRHLCLTRSHYFSCDLPVAGADFAGDLRSHFPRYLRSHFPRYLSITKTIARALTRIGKIARAAVDCWAGGFATESIAR